MLKMKRMTETFDMKVFTDSGDYFGDVEDAIVTESKVSGWKVRPGRNSSLSKAYGPVKGVIVSQQIVKAIGDIMIISSAAVTTSNAAE